VQRTQKNVTREHSYYLRSNTKENTMNVKTHTHALTRRNDCELVGRDAAVKLETRAAQQLVRAVVDATKEGEAAVADVAAGEVRKGRNRRVSISMRK
jgi:hypothetical protein